MVITIHRYMINFITETLNLIEEYVRKEIKLGE